MTSVRVTHLLGALRPSGMERMLHAAARSFQDAGVAGSIVCQGDDHSYRAPLEHVGYPVHVIPPLRSPSGWMHFRSALVHTEADILHVHTEGAFAAAVSIARTVRPSPVIIRTVHNVFSPVTARARLSRFAQSRIADRFVTEFTAPTSEVAEHEARWRRDVRVVANWIDDSFFEPSPTPREARTAVIVGNCSTVKNHELALQAAMAAGYSVFHVGDESEASQQELALLSMLERSGRLLHRGAGDPLAPIRRASVFLMPSLREGMGVALAEAMTCGTPAAVSDAPGLRWARDLPHVTHLPLDPASWESFLRTHDPVQQPARSIAPDFRAARGVADYTALYMRALVGNPGPAAGGA